MARGLTKKRTVVIAVIVSMLMCGCLLWLAIPTVSHFTSRIRRIETSHCTASTWETFDRPELVEQWKAKLNKVGLKAIDVSISSKRDGSSCLVFEFFGLVYQSEEDSSATSTKIYGTIQVESIADDAALGEVVIKMLTALEPKMPYDEFYNADIHLTFMAEQNKSIDFHLYEVSDLQKQGLRGAELFQALDDRDTPPATTKK